MTVDQLMRYEPQVGDKVRFLQFTREGDTKAEPGDTGYVYAAAGSDFVVRLDREPGYNVIFMCAHGSKRIPHDLMRIECYEKTPTPCENNIDVDAVIETRKLNEIDSSQDVEIKAMTLLMMCQEIRQYRLTEKREREEADAEADLENEVEPVIPLAPGDVKFMGFGSI